MNFLIMNKFFCIKDRVISNHHHFHKDHRNEQKNCDEVDYRPSGKKALQHPSAWQWSSPHHHPTGGAHDQREPQDHCFSQEQSWKGQRNARRSPGGSVEGYLHREVLPSQKWGLKSAPNSQAIPGPFSGPPKKNKEMF